MSSHPICPYPGLRPFNEEESIYFKGRETHVEKIMELLEEKKFLMLTGASGDGKSSLVYAGLIPQARAGFFKAKYSKWLVADFRPERNPLKNLANAIAHQLKIDPGFVESKLKHGFSALINLYTDSDFFLNTETDVWKNRDEKEQRKLRLKAGNLLIIIDQFEEFFTNPENFYQGTTSSEAKLVINLINETNRLALEKNIPVYIVCTMRSDYIGNCATFHGLPELIGKSHYFIPQLSRGEISNVIEEPAILSGTTISSRLKERLLYDLKEGMDVLPVLQHALNRVWNIADQENSREIDLIHYAKAAGMKPQELPEQEKQAFIDWYNTQPDYKKAFYENPGLENVLNAHADELYEICHQIVKHKKDGNAITKEDTFKIIKTTFTCLTRIDETKAVRNRMSVGEIVEVINDPSLDLEVVSEVLNVYRQPGNTLLRPFVPRSFSSLPTPDERIHANTVLDITHEALIRNWEKLFAWVKEEQDSITIFNDFSLQLNYWINSGKSKSYLLSSGQVGYFSEWYKKQHPTRGWIMKNLPDVKEELTNENKDPDEASATTKNVSDYLTNKNLKGIQAEKILADSIEFLEHSQKQEQYNRRNKKVTLAIGVLCSLLLMGFILVINLWSNSERLQAEIIKTAKANSIATKAYTTLEHDPTLAFRLAEAAYNISPTPLASQVIMAAYAEMPFYKKIEGHTDAVHYAAWSPDGKYVVTASNDNSAIIWRIDGSIKTNMKHHGALMLQTETIVFSPDGKYLLTCAFDSTSRLWDIDGKQLAILKHDHEKVWSVGFSGDGSRVLTASYDSTARVWDKSGIEILRLKHKRRVFKALFIPGTKRMITIAGSMFLWDEMGKPIKEIKKENAFYQIAVSHNGEMILGGDTKGGLHGFDNNGREFFSKKQNEKTIKWIDFSPDDKYIVIGDNSGLISLWNNMGEFLGHLRGHTASIWQVKFSQDGKKIASCSDDGTAKIWNLDGTNLMTLKGHSSQILSVNWSPDGRKVITASDDKTTRIWEVVPIETPLLIGHTGYVLDAGFSKDGNSIITAGWDYTSRLWDKTGKEINKIVHPEYSVSQALFSANQDIYTSNGNSVNILRFNNQGLPIDTFKHKDGIPEGGMEISEDASKIVSQDMAFNGYLWDTSGFLIQKFERQFLQMISGNYFMLLTISKDSSIYFWEQTQGIDSLRFEKFIQLIIPGTSFLEAKISKDENWMTTTSNDSTIRIWNMEEILLFGKENKKGECIKLGSEKVRKEIKLNSIVSSIVFSPIKNVFLSNSSDNIIRAWDITEKQIAEMKGHSNIIRDFNFSYDGKYLITGSYDKTVRLWDMTGKELMTYPGHKGTVNIAKFSPDGKYILSASLDHTARLMPISVEMVLDKINKEKVRGDVWEMSEAERDVYGIK